MPRIDELLHLIPFYTFLFLLGTAQLSLFEKTLSVLELLGDVAAVARVRGCNRTIGSYVDSLAAVSAVSWKLCGWYLGS